MPFDTHHEVVFHYDTRGEDSGELTPRFSYATNRHKAFHVSVCEVLVALELGLYMRHVC